MPAGSALVKVVDSSGAPLGGIPIKLRSLAGEPIHLDLDGLLSRVVQHEFDHLEGKLFTDRLPEAAALEVRRALDGFREVFMGKQSRGELPADERLLAELDRLEAARCRA